MNNSHRTPNCDRPESSATKHRNFRLTFGSPTTNRERTFGSFRDAIRFSVIQQLPLLILSALLLDGGLVFKRVAIASIAFWILILIIMIRRGRNIPSPDIYLVKWGYLPMLLTTCILWFVLSAILF